MNCDPEYRFEHGSLYLYKGDKMLDGYMDNEIAISFFTFDAGAESDYVLYKHGRKDLVQRNFEEAGRTKFAKFFVISFKVIPAMIEDLNKTITASGYINTFLKKYSILKKIEGANE